MEMNYKMVVHNHALKAAAAALLSYKVSNNYTESILADLSREFSHTPEQIKLCCKELLYDLLCPSKDKLSAIKRKFASDEYSGVSNLKMVLKNNL